MTTITNDNVEPCATFRPRGRKPRSESASTLRINLPVSPVEYDRVKRRAATVGVTMAEYLRKLVTADLAETP